MADIFLNDILRLRDEEIENCKMSLNISHGKNGGLCIDDWLKKKQPSDGFWCYYGKQRNFRLGQCCFAFYKLGWSGNNYLFVGAGKITRVPEKNENIPAEYEPIQEYSKFLGRIIIEVYKGNTRGRYNFNLKTYLFDCKIIELLPEQYGGEPFPGFDKLILNYEQLDRSIYINRSWSELLKKQKGIYVIVDKAPEREYSKLGRIYVGSATSQSGMLFDRWKNYVDSLSGGNKELEKVKRLKGEGYMKKYFQWSLVEHFDEIVDDTTILGREKYWKTVLNSVVEGLNDN